MFSDKYKKLFAQAEEQILQLQTELNQLKQDFQTKSQSLQQTEGDVSKLQADLAQKQQALDALTLRYAAILDIEKAVAEKTLQLQEAEQTRAGLTESYRASMDIFRQLENKINLYRDTLEIAEYGLYQPQYSFELPEQYKLELENIYQQQKKMVTDGDAVKCETEWVVGGSAAEGRKMIKQTSKLMLYAFNGESDAMIAKVKWNNVAKMQQRITDAFESINKLGLTNRIAITQAYCDLKLKELALTYEYEQKKYEEKEEQRRIKEQMREEEKAQREFERAQREAEDEEKRYQKALDKAKQELDTGSSGLKMEELQEKIRLLEANLQEAHERKERAISLAQMTKVGHIYVISNIGSFGEDVYKIGMTRRLDPHDRVRELGDASVPFQFDVHAIIFSENAPQLEYELHQKFKDKRLNRINHRKEFFRVSLEEIEEFVKQHTNADILFTKLAEAREFRETLTFIEQLTRKAEEIQPSGEFPDHI